jgi:hypothetical protein
MFLRTEKERMSVLSLTLWRSLPFALKKTGNVRPQSHFRAPRNPFQAQHGFGASSELSPLGGKGRIDLPTEGTILINVGSVGQPRDLCRDACYAVYDPQHNSIEFRRIVYDVRKTKRKILRAKLPAFAAQRLSLGR